MNRIPKKSMASNCRHPVYIQTLTPASNGQGGFTESWADGSSYHWAAILPLKSDQVYTYKTVDVEATHMVKIRGGVTISDKNRIRYGSRYFEVKYVEDIQERGIETWVTCKEVIE